MPWPSAWRVPARGFSSPARAPRKGKSYPTAAGNVRVYPAWSPVPNVSTVNYVPGQTRAGNAVIGLSPEGDLSILATQASGTVHAILDVVGYFE